MNTTRAQFLRNGGKGTLALVAGGTVLATMKGDAFAQDTSGGPTDAQIATFAAGAELLAVRVYGAAIGSKFFSGGTQTYLKNAQKAEREHYNNLAKALGSSAPKAGDFTYKLPSLNTAGKIVNFAITLETAFLGAYLAAVDALDAPAFRSLAASHAANEASHLGFFVNAKKPGAVIKATPKAGDLTKIIATVNSLAKPKAA